MQMGQRLWVCPSWTAPPDPAAVNILLDPGLAFGTGTHPTTAMCLRAIDAGVSHALRVVDYGCGSGILGIAAARLGSGPVLAIDNDPQALVASRANAEANGVGEDQFAVAMPDDSAVTQWSGTARACGSQYFGRSVSDPGAHTAIVVGAWRSVIACGAARGAGQSGDRRLRARIAAADCCARRRLGIALGRAGGVINHDAIPRQLRAVMCPALTLTP